MRILIVSPDFPWPPNHGGRLAVLDHMRGLLALGHQIDLISTVNTGFLDIKEARTAQLNRLDMVTRTRSLFDIFSYKPFQLVSRKALVKVPLKQNYDVIVLEGCYVTPILENPSLKAKRIFYRVHNDEASYFRNLAGSTINPFVKAFYCLESLRISSIEKRLVAMADTSLFISSIEFSGPLGQKARSPIFLPPAIDLSTMIERPLVGRTVIFVGSLFMRNNQKAVNWYLKHVHPQLLHLEGYRLIVAGRADEELGKSLRRRWSQRGLQLLISPQNLEPIYSQATVFVNPSLETAGVKIKTIEAVRNGIPVVSTPEGVSGSGLRTPDHVRLASTPEAFAKEVQNLLICQNAKRIALARSAAEFLRKQYDMENHLKRIYG